MKLTNHLSRLRVLLAICCFVPIFLFFVDFTGILHNGVRNLLHIQLMPAILSGMGALVILQLVLALIFGRIYCSVICPAGVLQDIINRIYSIGKKKRKGIHRFHYHKPANILRYSILGLTFVLGVFGFTELCLLLDPYSNFGRIATNLFRPVVMWGNNLVADIQREMNNSTIYLELDNYSVYNVTISTVTTAGLISAVAALFIFIIMVSLRGRLFCNTLCPVGALLSLVSRYSFFRISFDKSACKHCGKCSHSCKAEAINIKELTVDTSRCVDCFNCISSCSKGGMQYRFSPFFKKETAQVAVQTTSNTPTAAGRRTFLATTATIASSLPILSVFADGMGKRKRKRNGSGKKNGGKELPLTPPGSLSLERFKDKCTACHLCVVKCPSQVLRPAGTEFGLDYMLKPHLDYVSSYCNYQCTVCADVCPTHAIQPLTKEEKATTQVGIAIFFINRCIVKTEGTDCGACSEHCPTQAVHMVPYEGTLTIPRVNPDLCIGCGGCESICPVRPNRAIIIKSNPEHKFVEKPKEGEVKKVEVEEFGF